MTPGVWADPTERAILTLIPEVERWETPVNINLFPAIFEIPVKEVKSKLRILAHYLLPWAEPGIDCITIK